MPTDKAENSRVRIPLKPSCLNSLHKSLYHSIKFSNLKPMRINQVSRIIQQAMHSWVLWYQWLSDKLVGPRTKTNIVQWSCLKFLVLDGFVSHINKLVCLLLVKAQELPSLDLWMQSLLYYLRNSFIKLL